MSARITPLGFSCALGYAVSVEVTERICLLFYCRGQDGDEELDDDSDTVTEEQERIAEMSTAKETQAHEPSAKKKIDPEEVD